MKLKRAEGAARRIGAAQRPAPPAALASSGSARNERACAGCWASGRLRSDARRVRLVRGEERGVSD